MSAADPQPRTEMSNELTDAFNNLSVELGETIEVGITVGQARERAEWILACYELRDRVEKGLRGE